MAHRRRRVTRREVALLKRKRRVEALQRQRALAQLRHAGQAIRRRTHPAPVIIADDKRVARTADQLSDLSDVEELPPDVYLSLADARRALADRERASGGLATGLAIGLGAVAVLGLGVVICYLLFRRRDDGKPESLGEAKIIREIVQVPQVLTTVSDRLLAAPRYHDTEESDDGVPLRRTYRHDAVMKTFTLPSLTTARAEAVRLATASADVPHRVTVRVVSPAAAYAAIAFSPNELNFPGTAAIPVGDTLLLAAGDQQEIRLRPRQALYAKGSTTGVVVSVLVAESPDDE